MSGHHAILLRAAEPRAEVPPEDWRLMREGFAWLALAFPGLWLLFHGAWWAARAVIVLPLPFAWLLPWSAPIVSLALGFLVAFEGRDWLIERAERRGWRRVGVLAAGSLGEAESKLAVLATRGGLSLRASRATRPDPAGTAAVTGATAVAGATA